MKKYFKYVFKNYIKWCTLVYLWWKSKFEWYLAYAQASYFQENRSRLVTIDIRPICKMSHFQPSNFLHTHTYLLCIRSSSLPHTSGYSHLHPSLHILGTVCAISRDLDSQRLPFRGTRVRLKIPQVSPISKHIRHLWKSDAFCLRNSRTELINFRF